MYLSRLTLRLLGDHEDACASLCTDYNDDPRKGCELEHDCWCPDGKLSYAEFQTKHPDVRVLAEG